VVDAVPAESLVALGEVVRHRIGSPAELSCGIGIPAAEVDPATDPVPAAASRGPRIAIPLVHPWRWPCEAHRV